MILDQQRIERVNKYFVPNPPTPTAEYVKMGIGGGLFVFAILAFASGGAGACFGVVLLLAALGLEISGVLGYLKYKQLYAAANPKATDPEMDAWLTHAEPNIVNTGLVRLNIHPSERGAIGHQNPNLVFCGVPYNEMPYRSMTGRDGRIRYSHYKIMVVYLSDWRLPVYECVLDMATGATITDSTKEYKLTQVDGMETGSDRINLFGQRPGGMIGAGFGAPGMPMPGMPGPGMPGPGMPGANMPIGHATGLQMINLLVSGRVAISLMLAISAEQSIYIEDTRRQPSAIDSMISQLREHLRTRSDGAQAANPAMLGGAPTMLGAPNVLGPAGPPPDQFGLAPPPQLAPPTMGGPGQPGYPQGQNPQPGYPQPGYAQPGYAQPGYAQPEYPPAG